MLSEAEIDGVLGALSNARRRRILDTLRTHPGSTVGELCEQFAISRIAVMKHLSVLEKAELVVSRREGRCRRLFLNVVPIRQVYDRWSSDWADQWAGQLTALKYRVELGGEA